MYSLNLQNSTIYFKDIRVLDLPQILKWYNKVDEFKYATGIDKPITLRQLTQKYAEVAICSNEFFVGVYIKNEDKMIGILKGSLKYRNMDAVWISSIAIDTAYQNKGYGQRAIDLLLGYLNLNCKVKSAYLAVIEENIQGKNFWLKQKFSVLRRIEDHLKIQDKQQNVIIMYKKIYS